VAGAAVIALAGFFWVGFSHREIGQNAPATTPPCGPLASFTAPSVS
jgi:hypothetical protein